MTTFQVRANLRWRLRRLVGLTARPHERLVDPDSLPMIRDGDVPTLALETERKQDLAEGLPQASGHTARRLSRGGLTVWVTGAFLLGWVLYAAWTVAMAATAASQPLFVAPRLSDYPPLSAVKLEPQRTSVDARGPRTESKTTDDLAKSALRQFAAFENARAEPVLRSTRTVVTQVVPGSAAERAGIVSGDVIAGIDGRAVTVVWDLYRHLTDESMKSVSLALRRGTEEVQAQLAATEEALDMTTHGLRFEVPSHLRFVGTSDLERLVEQLRAHHLSHIPDDQHQLFLEGLVLLSEELSVNGLALRAIGPDRPGYVRSEDLITWYRQRFSTQVHLARGEHDQLQRQLARVISGLALALAAVAAWGVLMSSVRAWRSLRGTSS